MSIIDWANPVPHIRMKKGKPFHESRYQATCLCCGAKRLLKSWDARKVEASGAPCQRCANVIKGKAGYAATAAKKGALWVREKAREKRLAHPSNLEKLVIDALEDLGLIYEREVACGSYFIDFTVGNVAIEVEGAYVHALRDPQKEAARYAFIQQTYKLLILREADASSFLSIIRSFMEKRNVRNRQTVFAYA